jgi:hypothetical protein
MAFILSEQRNRDVVTAFRLYRGYLEQHRPVFPAVAHALASSEWYYDPADHRCPHDAWLEDVRLVESGSGKRREGRATSIFIRLLGAYHDGHVEFHYPQVFRYDLQLNPATHGHRDWRYDEFRVTDDGHLLHEIEWWSHEGIGRWLIEASDVEFSWRPKS